MGFSGTLETLNFTEILQWCRNERKTGTLTVGRPGVKKEIYFEDGLIVSAGSNDPREYLGQYLLSIGTITEEHLREAFETQKRTKVLLGKILLVRGLIAREELERALRAKIMETIFNLFLWDTGFFHFNARPLSEKDRRVDVALDTDRCVLEGLGRAEDWKRFQAVFPDDRMVLAPGDRTPPAGAGDAAAGRIIRLVAEGRSIAEIRLELHTGAFALLAQLHALFVAGHVRTTGVLKEPAAPAPPAGAYRDEEEERTHLARLLPAAAVPARVPDPEVTPGVTFSSEEVYVLSRVNGQWDVSALVMTSPLREVEVLRILKRFLDLGLISL